MIANLAQGEKAPVESVLPKEGATGWSDTWMVGAKSEHKTCAYKLIDHLVSPKTNAAIAEYFGEAPANKLACQETTDPNHCDDLPRRGRGLLLQGALLEHPDLRVPGRSHRREVHRLRGVDQEVVGDPRLTALDTPVMQEVEMKQRRTPFALLAAPMTWLVVAYLGALGVHLRDGVLHHRPVHQQGGRDVHAWRTSASMFSPTYLRIIGRTLLIAALVTVLCIVDRGAVRVLHGAGGTAAAAGAAGRRGAGAAVGVVPRQGLRLAGDASSPSGVMDSAFGSTPGYGLVAVVLTLTYLWLPYMILPVYAGFERLPEAHLEASADLGGSAGDDVPRGSCCRR